ncbi:MAG TPA: HlyD family efflux transporter periplasmic adaptor subunit [Longimicrobiales bacterium]|nr:HlyD family efflux transporter periplasmic adaptor subunit [Longimicrobiales bacterium]
MTDPERPRLKAGLRFIRRAEDGRTFYVVKDPLRMKYYRFGEPEVALMGLLDGERTTDEIAAALGASAASVAPFIRRLKEMELVERSRDEQRILLVEMARKQRTLRRQGEGNTLLRMRFSFGDPDALFDRLIPRLRFLYTPGFVLVSLLAFLAYGAVVAAHWDQVAGGVARLYDPTQYTLGFLGAIYALSAVLFAAHELGHGLTCKHFGGEVHEIGAMLFYFSPAFYCNVNDAWTFEKLSHRLWVTFAGGWIQLFLGGVSALVWVVAEPGTMAEQLAFAGVILGGGIILLVNFNPLIPLDGYYALMDWLRIPNLRPRSFAYLGAWVQRRVLRLDVTVPGVTPRERRIFLVYGAAALAYTALILTVVGIFLGGLIVRALGAWGWAIVLFAAWRMMRQRVRAAARVARSWTRDTLRPLATHRLLLGAGAGALLVATFALLPWTIRVTGSAAVEPLERVWLRSPETALVERIPVRDGDTVRAGDIVALLRDPELEMQATVAAGRVATLERERDAATSAGRSAVARAAAIELEAARAAVVAIERRREALRLRAPFPALVVTRHLEEREGAGLEPGDSLLELWRTGPLRVRIALAQAHAGDVRPGTPVGIRFPGIPASTWRTRVARVRPATDDRQVVVLAPLGVTSELRPGMVGTARLALRRTTVAAAVAWSLRRTFRTDWLL